MATEVTAAQRAAAVVDKVKSELTPIWLGGRQRMILEREIALAICEAIDDYIMDRYRKPRWMLENELNEMLDKRKFNRLASEGG